MAKRTCSIEGCGNPFYARGWCHTHYAQWWRDDYSTPRAFWRRDLTPEQRLWARVEIGGPDECWPWTGPVAGLGYGQTRHRGSTTSAHRLALAFTEGIDPPVGLHAAHSCDNPPCCNPAHLHWATPAENTAERGTRGRTATASRMPNATPADVVRAIRALVASGARQKDAVERYGLDSATVSRMVRGITHRDKLNENAGAVQ